jgi:hypothetical protein
MLVKSSVVDKAGTRTLLGGCALSMKRIEEPNVPTRKLLAGQSGHKALKPTSCGHFTFNPNILCSPRVIHNFSTAFPQMTIRFPRKVLFGDKVASLKRLNKKTSISGGVSVRNVVDLRDPSVCGKLPCKGWNHAQYTPYARANVFSVAPISPTCMAMYSNV